MKNSQNTDSNKVDNTPGIMKDKIGRNRADISKNISSKYHMSKESKLKIEKKQKKHKKTKKEQKEVDRQKDVKLKEENLQNILNNNNINAQAKIKSDSQKLNKKVDKIIIEPASNLDNTKSETSKIKLNPTEKINKIDLDKKR